MADVLDRIREKQRLAENTDLAQAEHNADWSETFSNTPPADVLRDRVNLADTVNRVQRNRLALAAQSDRKALQLLDATARHEEWLRDAPLREQLLKSRIASQGAAQRFVERKDAETQKDLADFHEYMDAAPAVTDPGYKAYLNQGVSRFPRIIGTQVGADTLKRLQQEHEDVTSLIPKPGYKISGFDFDSNGKAHARHELIIPDKPAPLTPEEKLANDVARERALIQVRNEGKAAQKPREESFKHFNEELQAMVDSYGGAAKVPPERWAEFEKRKAALGSPEKPSVPSDFPTLTEKSQFDALPSGARYYRDGKLFQKP